MNRLTLVVPLAVSALLAVAASTASAAPVITLISPNSGSTAGGTVLTISGTGFSASGNTATVDGEPCHIGMGDEDVSSIRCTLPEGGGATNPVQVEDSLGELSNTVNFSYLAPSISMISPISGPASGGTVITITGSNFGASPSVTVNGNNCPLGVHGHTSLECTAPAGSGSNVPVFVSFEGQLGGPAFFSYVPAPAVASLVPSSGATSGGIPLTINGSNFAASGNSATVGGNTCSITSEGVASIVCTLPEGTGADRQVQVTTGGQPSNTLLFDYNPPDITSIEPDHASTQGSIPLTINGVNFGPVGADLLRSVTVGTAACPLLPSSSNHTQIVCTLPAGQGLGHVVGVEVDGQSSDTATFNYDPPSIDSITPGEAPTAGNIPITIVGQNFGTAAAVTVDGNGCPLLGQSHTEIQCTAPAGSGTDATVAVVVSGQVANSTIDYRDPACGDGIVDDDEDCDDTNENDLDGCSAACETEAVQDRDQAGCILALNKAGAGVAKAQGKDVAACARDAQSGVPCIGVANSASLDKAIAKIAAADTNKCATPPDFGKGALSAVEDASTGEMVGLAVDLFGAEPDAALVPDPMAPGRASCQQRVLQSTNKFAAAWLKSFGKCKKAGFKEETIRSASRLFSCLPQVDDEVVLLKMKDGLEASLQDACVDIDLAQAFPGECSAAPDVAACIEDRVRCRTCRALVATDALDGGDCDDHDDGIANASCP